MENITDAIYMASAVLLLVIALSIAISSFTTVREGVDQIMGQTEVMELAKDNSNEYINYIKANNANSTRIVGVETVTTTMYRCIKENYVVYLKLKNISDLTSKGITTVQAIDDLTSNDGTTLISKDDTLIRITIGENQNINQILKNNFNQIKNSTFYEFIGEYQIKTGEGVTTENKQTYRVITYVEI